MDLAQFWQEGKSDADTVKVLIKTRDAFQYRSNTNTPFKVTHVFENSKVVGKVKKSPIDTKGYLTIRLQGIDAPELHYSPSPISKKEKNICTKDQLDTFKNLNKEYRQHFGETATVKLHDLLKELGSNILECTVKTAVNEPNDVFDTYGRFIGDVIVKSNNKELNINRWLVENGWAFPTFYVSMSSEEIIDITMAAKQGHKNKNGIWKHYSANVGKFDFDLTFRNHGQPDAKSDVGQVIMPKIFRRQCTYSAYQKAKIFRGSFVSYLTKHQDACFLTKDILKKGISASKPYFFNMFFENSKFTKQPQDLTLSEKPSTLIDASGKKILKW